MKLTMPKMGGGSRSGSAPSMPKLDFAAIADEFRYLDTKDVGNWPRFPRVAALLTLFVLLLAAGWWFDWMGQLEELGKQQTEEATLRQSYLDKKRQSVNLDEYRKQLAEIDRSFGALLKQLPNKEGMESLLVDINQAGLGRGLQFELFKPGGEQIKDFYAELPIQLRITGNYHDLGEFAGDVAKLSRIVTLGSLAITAGAAPGAGSSLTMDTVAMTYRYLDASELAQVKAAQKKGGR